MEQPESVKRILRLVEPHLTVDHSDSTCSSTVLMTCGIAGSGKSTLAKAIVVSNPTFHRVSIDAILAARRGIYNVDYLPEMYESYQEEAGEEYLATVQELLRQGKNIVLERSFYAKEDRDEFKALVEDAGGRLVLVFLKADRELLWKRICERRAKGVDADSAREISEELLDQYFSGFEEPNGEGEITVQVE